MESTYNTIDLALDERQKANESLIDGYAIQIGETNEALTEWSETPKPKAEYGMYYTVRQSVKFGIIGGAVGFALSIFVLAFLYILKGYMYTDRDWERLGVPVLAHIHSDKQHKSFAIFDKWIDKYIGGVPEEPNMQADCKLAAAKLKSVMNENSMKMCCLTGDLSSDIMTNIIDSMNRSESGSVFMNAGNALHDPDAAKKIEEFTDVVLIGSNNKTKISDVHQELAILKAWGKRVIGAIHVIN